MTTALDNDELERLVEHEIAVHRPRTDYGELSDEELVARMALLEFEARRVVIEVMDTGKGRWVGVYERAIRMAFSLPDTGTLARLRDRGADGMTLRFLVWSRLESQHLYAELAKRLKPFPIGQEMLGIGAPRDGGQEGLRRLLAAIHVERMTSFRPEEEPDEDVRAVALEAAIRRMSEMSEQTLGEMLLPDPVAVRSPPGLGAGPVRWERLRGEEVRMALGLFLPVLRGEVESLPQNVHQAMRDHFEKRKAQKRKGEVVQFDGLRDTPHPVESLSRMAARLDSSRAYEEIAHRYGERGRQFVDALAAGKSIKEASKLAGISRQMGHRYVKEAKRRLEPKK